MDDGAWRAGARDGVTSYYDRLWTAVRGGPGGFCRDRWTIYGAKKVRIARLDIYAKFALSFAKLAKIQTPNAKPLDTSFYDF